MLALLERTLADRGGTDVYCDTDSMAVVPSEQGGLLACAGGPEHLADGREAIRALSWDESTSSPASWTVGAGASAN